MPRESEKPEIYSINRDSGGTRFSRRGFLFVGAALLAGSCTPEETCDDDKSKTVIWNSYNYNDICAHSSKVTATAFSADGKYLITGASKEIKVWLLENGAHVATNGDNSFNINSIAFDAARNKVIALEGRTIKLFDFPQCTPDAVLYEDENPIMAFHFFPSAGRLAAICEETVKLISYPGGEVVSQIDIRKRPIKDYAFSPDGNLLALQYTANLVKIYSIQREKYIADIYGSDIAITAMAFHPGGETMLTGDRNERIYVWSLPEGNVIKSIQCHEHTVESICFSLDGRFFASGDLTSIKLWETKETRLLRTASPIFTAYLVFSPDAKCLVSANANGNAQLWEIPSMAHKASLMDVAASKDSAQAVQYKAQSAGGEWLTYTVPCGAPLPENTTCVCNCVSVSAATRQKPGGTTTTTTTGHYWYPN